MQLVIADWVSPWQPKARRPARTDSPRRRINALAAPLPPILAYIEKQKAGGKQHKWDEKTLREVELRWFCLQTPQGIAHDLGLTKSTVATKAFRLELPKRYGLPLTDDFDPAREAKYAHLFKGWERKVCGIRKQPFWSNRKGVRWSQEARRKATYRNMMLGGDSN